MTGLSLFSGIGGMDLAFEAAGGKVIAFCEREPYCQKVLRKHWPRVPIFSDVTTLRGEDVGAVDIVFGGPPCQPVSVAGRRRGQDDERYLWGDVFRIVADIMPRFCVFENVLGILSIAADDICKSLECLGYSVGICCFEAAAVGVPHRRARVFFVAHSQGYRCGARPLQCGGSREAYNETPNYTVAGSGEPSIIVPNTGRWMREGSSIPGTFRGEHGEKEAFDLKRSDSALTPDADGTRQLQQGGSIGKFGEWAGNGCKDVANTMCERREEQQCPVAQESSFADVKCSSWWLTEPDVGRVANGIPHRVDRLRALGNAVVPKQVYTIFKSIIEAGGGKSR